MEKKEFFKREDLKKKLVIAADTTIVGEVTDIVFSPDGKVWPLIESKTPKGPEEKFIIFEEIDKIKDVMILKPTVEEKVEALKPTLQHLQPLLQPSGCSNIGSSSNTPTAKGEGVSPMRLEE